MKTAKLIYIIISIIILASAVNGLSASIGNAKAIVRVNLTEVPTVLERSILVNNVNEIPVRVEIKPGSSLQGIIQVKDKEFELQPDESLKARYKVVLTKPGTYQGKIFVAFAPADSSIKEQPMGLAASLAIIAIPVKGVNYNETSSEKPAASGKTTHSAEEKNTEENSTKGVRVSTSGGKQKTASSNSNEKPSVLIGIISVVVIVAIGGLIFYLLTKKGVF